MKTKSKNIFYESVGKLEKLSTKGLLTICLGALITAQLSSYALGNLIDLFFSLFF